MRCQDGSRIDIGPMATPLFSPARSVSAGKPLPLILWLL